MFLFPYKPCKWKIASHSYVSSYAHLHGVRSRSYHWCQICGRASYAGRTAFDLFFFFFPCMRKWNVLSSAHTGIFTVPNLPHDPWFNEAFWPMGSLWKWRPPLSLQEKITVEKAGRGQPIRKCVTDHSLQTLGGHIKRWEKHDPEGCTAETVEAKEKWQWPRHIWCLATMRER